MAKSGYEHIFKADTLEKAVCLLDTIRLMKLEGTVEGLNYLIKEHPEIRKCSHQYIADLLGLARETVTRAYKYT